MTSDEKAETYTTSRKEKEVLFGSMKLFRTSKFIGPG